MRRASVRTGLAFALAVAATAAAAQQADVRRGRETAERWCAPCHIVSPGQRQGPDAVPTFAALARRPWTETGFANALATPHPPMPSLSLTRRERADLLVYLRRQAD